MDWKYDKDDTVYLNCCDSDWGDRHDIACRVKRRLTADEADLDETGPMYEVEFVDTHRVGLGCIHAFEDELTTAPVYE